MVFAWFMRPFAYMQNNLETLRSTYTQKYRKRLKIKNFQKIFKPKRNRYTKYKKWRNNVILCKRRHRSKESIPQNIITWYKDLIRIYYINIPNDKWSESKTNNSSDNSNFNRSFNNNKNKETNRKKFQKIARILSRNVRIHTRKYRQYKNLKIIFM